MNNLKRILTMCLAVSLMTSCDKGFEQLNTNPLAITQISDPGLLLTNILRNTSTAGGWDAESTIVQHFVLPYNVGATLGYQFNDNNPGINAGPWGVYTGVLRTTGQLITLVKDNPARSNLYNMARIWRAYHFMWLVDHYGDVPYSEALQGQAEGKFYPKYDKGAVIYEDLYKEIKEATAALDPAKDNNAAFDIFVSTSASTAAEITFWKRLGYSLLLRLGMRYSKVDANKARTIVTEAFNGGVMQTNADNVVVRNMTDAGAPIVGFENGRMTTIRVQNAFNYYVAEPFVDTLKRFRDPRLKFIAARYAPLQSTAPQVVSPDTTMANQFGFPVGIDQSNFPTTHPSYRAPTGTGQNFSQLNYNVVANMTTPSLVITNAQTKLLLAEAAFRNWLPAGAQTAQQYYEAGVKASMDAYTLFPNTTPIPVSLQNEYLNVPGVAWDNSSALSLINTQYWIENFNNGYEAWCNWRRTGLPVLKPNLINANLAGGFIRRFSYPQDEQTTNAVNYQAAVSTLGGPDFLTTRIFWDTP
ncbi:SusD/RagB family nutrient-binding outer membrane lipoprotein [Segetibacter sp. 3557_3]|uniref:SusD/RagB family nutrient-binding outer membrane lipoprotein n=1 Tax=Segetibacter sp. 3557_3 TaxID=2547429 RepID=UPI00105889DA|nr:SusD/RagB family nutrient-binding outer membrane lipoprotein [Segetibacter sp. 3557_3]TDH23475.1 SusD/RagB family nutrient-binding outer membrane lipoprotein [Segetibacter sp. 3557_3]